MYTPERQKLSVVYDKGTMKVVVLACFIIVIAVLLTSGISYLITNKEIVDKLKTRDMFYIIGSISAKIDGRIERAKETSFILARDTAIVKWVAGAEKDDDLGQYAKQKINDIASRYDYNNAFIVSNVTGNYWDENYKLIDTMNASDPDDLWFFETIRMGKPISLSIDYNEERGDTFVFVNALMGDPQQPLAVTGVGLSLKELAKEFQSYKFGDKSNLWLINDTGKIHLSEDVEHTGKSIYDFLPSHIGQTIVSDRDDARTEPKVLEYNSSSGTIIDLAYVATKSTGWKLIFQIPRDESVAMLESIKFNAALASMITLVIIVFIFYLLSSRIANPFKRALALSQEMERQVQERTRELAESNQKIIDSIDYAKRIQESVLPSTNDMALIAREFFVIWRPRDVVGGDFYWVRCEGNQRLIVVADCTGHGVPGAFMTMALNSILDRLVEEFDWNNPACLLRELNKKIKQTIHRKQADDFTDDGLDIGICFINDTTDIIFAGSKISLYVLRDNEVQVIPSHKKSLGYRRSPWDMEFVNYALSVTPGDTFYMTTDGFLDQNGGSRDYPLGRKRFAEMIIAAGAMPMGAQKAFFETELARYMGDAPQRDDITVIGFRL